MTCPPSPCPAGQRDRGQDVLRPGAIFHDKPGFPEGTAVLPPLMTAAALNAQESHIPLPGLGSACAAQ